MQVKRKTITKKRLTQLSDPYKITKAANLVYVSDNTPGITRIKCRGGFTYRYRNKTITDAITLQRIKSLVIPPAWKNVWICPKINGHIQATGFDTVNRKQYRYHPTWNLLRNHTKYSNMYSFGQVLPAIRTRIHEDLSLRGLCMNKVLAAAISIMQCTCMRIGSNIYEKLYGSFGLTTLKDKHVKINGIKVKFSFKGKKGVYHNLSLKSRKLANIIKQCRDIPGKELFQFYDDDGTRHAIDSGMLNNYIKEISGGSFTAKDFRTWAGSVYAITAFRELGACSTVAETKKNIVEALDKVAAQLGNTRAVCKKYYVHPAIIEHYTNNTLQKYLAQPKEDCGNEVGLHVDEQLLMDILQHDSGTITI